MYRPHFVHPSIHLSRHPIVVFSPARHHVREMKVKSAFHVDKGGTPIVRHTAGDEDMPLISKQ